MTVVVRVDVTDNTACNIHCLGADRYCNRYPHCVAGYFHRVQDWLTPGDVDRQIIREDRVRSAQGGYSQGRVIRGPNDDVVEEVELHCRTLEFESLIRVVPEVAAAPSPTAKVEPARPRAG